MKHRITGAALAALFLTAPAQVQDHDLYLVVYMGDSTSPAGLVDAPQDRTGCEQLAAAETAKSIAAGEPFRVKCEFRGPNDMLWKLHPYLRGK